MLPRWGSPAIAAMPQVRCPAPPSVHDFLRDALRSGHILLRRSRLFALDDLHDRILVSSARTFFSLFV